MVSEFILGIVFNIVDLLLSPLALINVDFDLSNMDFLQGVIGSIFYIIPIGAVLPLILINVALFGFRIVVRIVKTIWDLLPLV